MLCPVIKNKDKKMLNEKQKKFCDEYLKTGNATQSYLLAGYNIGEKVAKVNASRLLTNANVIEYIKERQQQVSNERIADIQEAQEVVTELMRDKAQHASSRLKAAELLGKFQGGFTESINVNARVGVVYEEMLRGLKGDEF